jgi:hypothetical protein
MKIPLTKVPCPRCLELAQTHQIRVETLQRLPEGAFAPLAKMKYKGPICFDCRAAEFLWQHELPSMTFLDCRIVIGNERQEQYRKVMHPSVEGDFEDQIKWITNHLGMDLGYGLEV